MSEVWVLEEGYLYEGGSVIGVFEKEAGRKKLEELVKFRHKQLEEAKEFSKEDYPEDDSYNNVEESFEETEDKIIYYINYEWFKLTKYEVVSFLEPNKDCICNGAGWVWRHELPDTSDWDGSADDTKYPCPHCRKND